MAALFRRHFTRPGVDPLDEVPLIRRSSVIANPDGSVVFRSDGIEVPRAWSQLATDILASKYFRRTGVPQGGSREPGAPTGSETSALQVVRRLARTLRSAGEKLGGYFSDPAEARAFEAELSYMLIHQIGAFNSPTWFNCGLAAEYGITGKPVGNYYWNEETDRIEEAPDAYTRPQLSACFIQSIDDDLMDIADAVKREMRLFKFGSGTGTNFSRLRGEGERLSAGGTSSGLMSFLEVLDRAAGATKSGGTTRRAAKMVILDMDHPEIDRFVLWKAREEEKVAALIAAGFPADFNGEAYRTVGGQNSNNSVRVTDAFMEAVLSGGEWVTRYRTTGQVARTWNAADLFEKICQAAWRCADPGIQFDTTINRWHTCPNTDRIRASNPCSEYMFLDDSACNLASVNLLRFLAEDGSFDVTGFRHACRIFFIAQEIIIDFASYPTERIARNSHNYRPLGLGFANLGTLLMVMGVPYDSDRGRSIAAAISAIMTGHAYRVSAEMAARKGPFHGFAENREPMLRVMNMHRDSAYAIDESTCPADLVAAARQDWDDTVRLGEQHGYRNSQTTVIAPTGTIGLLMDCDTTGVEPDFALVKFKKLAGGGHFKIVNQSVPAALRTLGYRKAEIEDIVAHIQGTQTFVGDPDLHRGALRERGLLDREIDAAEAVLPGAFAIGDAFQPHVLGAAAFERLRVEPAGPDAGRRLLLALGFAADTLLRASDRICGAMTIEGAPHVDPAHLPVFDCANPCGEKGRRFIHHMGHIRMMAAVQPFISGAISKTINMPANTDVAAIREAFLESWRLGLKAVAIYRDGCKLSQPLATRAREETTKEPPAPAADGTAVPAPETGDGSARRETSAPPAEAGPATPTVHVPTDVRPARRRLPRKRHGFTQEALVGGQKVYLRTGDYENGELGEIFIDMHKEGAAFRSMMNCFAIAVSLGLQYGVPLEEYVNVFTFTRFPPQGPVKNHPNVKFATSVVDYIFRVLALEYLGRTDFVQVKPADGPEEELHGLASEVREPETPESPAADPPPVLSGGAGPQAARPVEPHVNGTSPAAAGPSRRSKVVLDDHLGSMMGDAPFCDMCGHITVRNGACYKCLNCGSSIGCS